MIKFLMAVTLALVGTVSFGTVSASGTEYEIDGDHNNRNVVGKHNTVNTRRDTRRDTGSNNGNITNTNNGFINRNQNGQQGLLNQRGRNNQAGLINISQRGGVVNGGITNEGGTARAVSKIYDSGNSDVKNTITGGRQYLRNANDLSNNNRNRIKNSGNSNNNVNVGTVRMSGDDGDQGAGNVRTFSPDSTATARSDSNSNQNQRQRQYQKQKQTQSLSGNNSSANNDGNNTSIDASDNSNTVYEAPDIPVSTAYAPALTSSNDTCMGSTSVGGQGMLIGLSFGTTWTDNDCITRKDARFVHNAGHRIVALSLMCGKEAVRAAVARAGTPEQIAACAITEGETESYRAKPIVVSVRRKAPDNDTPAD